eukprot:1143273-Pelagomonas_calceolata.AAC.4
MLDDNVSPAADQPDSQAVGQPLHGEDSLLTVLVVLQALQACMSCRGISTAEPIELVHVLLQLLLLMMGQGAGGRHGRQRVVPGIYVSPHGDEGCSRGALSAIPRRHHLRPNVPTMRLAALNRNTGYIAISVGSANSV